MRKAWFLITVLVITLLAGCAAPATKPVEVNAETWARFEAKLEYIHQQMKIPGISAAIVMDQKLVWAKGFGYADPENHIEAAPDTPYQLISASPTPLGCKTMIRLTKSSGTTTSRIPFLLLLSYPAPYISHKRATHKWPFSLIENLLSAQ